MSVPLHVYITTTQHRRLEIDRIFERGRKSKFAGSPTALHPTCRVLTSNVAVSNMAYGRLFAPPASIAPLKGAYVSTTLFHSASLYEWSGDNNTLVSMSAALSDAMASIGRAAYLEAPITGQDLIAAGGCWVGITLSPSASGT
ncbi:hypothetical protein [Sphingomonas faeni]|uniref:hypothetical protein n=1 Tax=Sphingomonas faeni TaxID=185950 RepID=UPI002785645B|nr:hypothetical protein [Sphingomonas faeni]MDQ0839786.1 hypothetical protein [Sphingomonas faeni]